MDHDHIQLLFNLHPPTMLWSYNRKIMAVSCEITELVHAYVKSGEIRMHSIENNRGREYSYEFV